MYAIAVRDHQPVDVEWLVFRAGAMVEVLWRKEGGVWLAGFEGRRGWINAGAVRIVGEEGGGEGEGDFVRRDDDDGGRGSVVRGPEGKEGGGKDDGYGPSNTWVPDVL